MPRVSLVGAGHGGSEDYATLALWWTAESGVDYGSKIEAVCSGNSGLASLMITGVTPNGYAIYAKTGEAFDGTNELTCPQSGGVLLASANGSFSGLACTGSGSTKGMSQTGQDTVVEFNFLTHGGTSDAANQNSTATNKIMRNNVIKGVGNFAFVANSNTFLNQLENNTVIGNSAWGILASNSSVLIQNNFSFGHATNDINSNTGVFVTNATQDTSGNAGLTGFTSAELVDFAGGDYRTKATSTLATAGTGAQGFIGAFLETGGGGISGTITQTAQSFTQSLSGSVVNQYTGTITQNTQSFTQSASGSVTSEPITGIINQTVTAFTQSALGDVVSSGISGAINQTASAFTQSATGSAVLNISGVISQTVSAFTQSLSGTVAEQISGTINQTVSSFTMSAVGRVPASWTDKLPASTTWADQTAISTIWTDK